MLDMRWMHDQIRKAKKTEISMNELDRIIIYAEMFDEGERIPINREQFLLIANELKRKKNFEKGV